MKKNVIGLAVLLCLSFVACIDSDYDDTKNVVNEAAVEVSIIQMIANTDEYHGMVVRVIGVGNLEFEGNAVYLSRDDWKNSVDKNGLWIELSANATPYDKAKQWNGKYVILEGTFDMKQKGHMDSYSGAIVDISRYELWET